MKRADLDDAVSLADRLDEIRAMQADLNGMTASECRIYVGPHQSGAACDVGSFRFLRFLHDEADAITQLLHELGVEL